MKRFLLSPILIIVVSVFSAFAPKAGKGDTIEIKPGTQLVYEVNNQGTQYQFIVTVKKLDDGITFDWQMTNTSNLKGTLEMTEEAVESATGLYNYFSGGPTKLTDQTSVWISRSMWNDVHSEDEMTLISLDGGEAIGFFREDGGEYATQYKGKKTAMKISNLKSLVDTQVITVWENEKCPIIVKMDLGWTIELKEIK